MNLTDAEIDELEAKALYPQHSIDGEFDPEEIARLIAEVRVWRAQAGERTRSCLTCGHLECFHAECDEEWCYVGDCLCGVPSTDYARYAPTTSPEPATGAKQE